jgi:hypothetical protein
LEVKASLGKIMNEDEDGDFYVSFMELQAIFQPVISKIFQLVDD